MVFTKSFLIPSLRIATVTTSPSCFFYHITMSLMISIFKTLQTNYTSLIHSTIKTFNNYDKNKSTCIFVCNYFCAYLLINFLWFRYYYIFFKWFLTILFFIYFSHLFWQYLDIQFAYFYLLVGTKVFSIRIQLSFIINIILILFFLIFNFLWHLIVMIWFPIFIVLLRKRNWWLFIHPIDIFWSYLSCVWCWLVMDIWLNIIIWDDLFMDINWLVALDILLLHFILFVLGFLLLYFVSLFRLLFC